jgi:dihydroorotase
MGSFSFDVGRQLIGQGIYPDSISSDVHAFNVNGPVFHVLHVASKFLCLGMPLKDVIARISSAPARYIGQHQFGRLSQGGPGDAVVLEEQSGLFEYTDSLNQKMLGERQLRPHAIILNGALQLDEQDPLHSSDV